MKYLIVEDSLYKVTQITNALREIDPKCEIVWLEYWIDAVRLLMTNHSDFDALFLDWNFKRDSSQYFPEKMGLSLLNHLHVKYIEMKIAICSYDTIDPKEVAFYTPTPTILKAETVLFTTDVQEFLEKPTK